MTIRKIEWIKSHGMECNSYGHFWRAAQEWHHHFFELVMKSEDTEHQQDTNTPPRNSEILTPRNPKKSKSLTLPKLFSYSYTYCKVLPLPS